MSALSPVTRRPIGLMAAMPQELQSLLDLMPDEARVERGGRTFWVGHLQGRAVVAVLSGIGKVAAAITATLLADAFGVSQIWFTGVAGGLGADVRVGDVVVADALLQHDMDASPLFPRHELPGLGVSRLHPPRALTDRVVSVVAEALLEVDAAGALHGLGLGRPRVHRGLIVSGDQFVSAAQDAETLRNHLPDVLAVEMEGAVVAQVCQAFGLPYAVVRSISDRADGSAHVDFTRFVDGVASPFTLAIVMALLRAVPDGAGDALEAS
ncbi:MAG: 5'-methylthioadenosine/adenosylhomocysteine nucleosidase [Burkholderiales bacterium]|nr:5'-methylthioadenosine/adenosylhomocysteine nucleosidase [Burkholderiales bacterium]MBH2016542.1 5'-methylthioadenosine/adenosylhomocysteine nucleosidase [Burkholderiales bacterium]